MGRILVMNHVSLDGVMQAPARPDEDTRGGFDLGGWALSDEAAAEKMGERMAAGGGLSGWLFGRRTYEDVLGYWTQRTDSPFGAALEGADKYVASTRPEEPLRWPNSTLLDGDVVEAVARLKGRVDGVLGIMGSGRLIETLLPHDLIDEFLLLVNPCVLGSGHRLFPEGTPPRRLRCVDAVVTPGGLLLATYARPDRPD